MLDVRSAVLALEDMFRFPEPFLHLSLSGFHLFKDVGPGDFRMKKGRLLAKGILDLENGRQGFDLHPQFVKGLLTGFRRQGSNRGNPVPDIEGLIRQDSLVFDQDGRRRIARTVEEAARAHPRGEGS